VRAQTEEEEDYKQLGKAPLTYSNIKVIKQLYNRRETNKIIIDILY